MHRVQRVQDVLSPTFGEASISCELAKQTHSTYRDDASGWTDFAVDALRMVADVADLIKVQRVGTSHREGLASNAREVTIA